jgi:hypothetical protein
MALENELGQIQFGALDSLKQQDKNEYLFHLERAQGLEVRFTIQR